MRTTITFLPNAIKNILNKKPRVNPLIQAIQCPRQILHQSKHVRKVALHDEHPQK